MLFLAWRSRISRASIGACTNRNPARSRGLDYRGGIRRPDAGRCRGVSSCARNAGTGYTRRPGAMIREKFYLSGLLARRHEKAVAAPATPESEMTDDQE